MRSRLVNASPDPGIPTYLWKVLLEHSHVRSFPDCLWLFSCSTGRVEQLEQTLSGPQRLKYLLFAFYRKSVLTPVNPKLCSKL